MAAPNRVTGYVPERELNEATSDNMPSPVTFDDSVEHNIITSRVKGVGRLHAPVLDIDFPARLIPSSSPGHFHLYLDGIRLSDQAYVRLLQALADCNIISGGYAHASIERGYSAVRVPTSIKPVEHQDNNFKGYESWQ